MLKQLDQEKQKVIARQRGCVCCGEKKGGGGVIFRNRKKKKNYMSIAESLNLDPSLVSW